MPDWTYSTKDKSYIDENGERLSEASLNGVRDAYLDGVDPLLNDYAENLASGSWTVAQFEREVRTRLKHAYISEYVLGRGGVNSMEPADWGRVGNMLRRQYGYLREFLDDITAGDETANNALRRTKNFLGSARQGFSRGRGTAYGFELPVHPGDGNTPCHGSCRCSWELVEDETEIRAYWQTSSEKPCDGCQSRANSYSPFVFVKGTTE